MKGRKPCADSGCILVLGGWCAEVPRARQESQNQPDVSHECSDQPDMSHECSDLASSSKVQYRPHGMSTLRLDKDPQATPNGEASQKLAQRVRWLASSRNDLPPHVIGATACALLGGTRVAVFGGRISLRGGIAGNVSGELHVLEVQTGRWSDHSTLPGGPPKCFEHAATTDESGRVMFVHGGRGAPEGPVLDSFRQLRVMERTKRWEPVTPAAMTSRQLAVVPEVMAGAPARRAHSVCCSAGLGGGAPALLLLFGGYGHDGDPCCELHLFDRDEGIWMTIAGAGSPGPARACHTATMVGPYMVVFGGLDVMGTPLQDLRLLHLPTLIWHHHGCISGLSSPCLSSSASDAVVVEPPARAGHAAVSLATSECEQGQAAMLILGGRGQSGGILGDTFKLSLTLPHWTLGHRHEGPPAGAAIGFTIGELRRAISESQRDHAEQAADDLARKEELREDIRSLTNKVSEVQVRTTEMHDSKSAVKMIEESAEHATRQEEAKLQELHRDTTEKLHQLDTEMENIQCQITRLEQELSFNSKAVFSADVDLKEEVMPEVPNPLCPLGQVERRSACWQGQAVSVELIGLNASQWKAWEKAARCELMIAHTVGHPHLQEVYAIFYTGSHWKKPQPCLAAIVEPHRPEEMLTAHLHGARRLSENQAFHVTHDLVSVLAHLHANGTIHRHIIPENVLVQQRAVGFIGKLAGLFTARVSCRVFYSSMVRRLSRAEARSWSVEEDRRSLSLAVVDARPADMKDLGHVLLQLWTAVSEDLASRPSSASHSSTPTLGGSKGVVQYDNSLHGDDALLAAIRDKSMRHFVSCLLADDPVQRPSAKQAQNMLFIMQDSDTLKLPDVPNDVSRTSPLVDLAAEGLLKVGVV